MTDQFPMTEQPTTYTRFWLIDNPDHARTIDINNERTRLAPDQVRAEWVNDGQNWTLRPITISGRAWYPHPTDFIAPETITVPDIDMLPADIAARIHAATPTDLFGIAAELTTRQIDSALNSAAELWVLHGDVDDEMSQSQRATLDRIVDIRARMFGDEPDNEPLGDHTQRTSVFSRLTQIVEGTFTVGSPVRMRTTLTCAATGKLHGTSDSDGLLIGDFIETDDGTPYFMFRDGHIGDHPQSLFAYPADDFGAAALAAYGPLTRTAQDIHEGRQRPDDHPSAPGRRRTATADPAPAATTASLHAQPRPATHTEQPPTIAPSPLPETGSPATTLDNT